MKLNRLLFTCGVLISLFSCSSASQKKEPELSKLRGKSVALVEVEGDRTARKTVEVALVNQLMERGTFLLISKQEFENAKKSPALDPLDWKSAAKLAGAEYGLRAEILQFSADTQEGYSIEAVEDSQLKAERGENDAQTERIFKVKSLTGTVKIRMEFTDLSTHETRVGFAEAKEQITEEAKSKAIHLPPKLRFLEKIANKAFFQFFDRYN